MHATEVLSFGNERNEASIGNFFDAGNDSLPQYDGTGPNDNVIFSANAVALKNAAASGTGKFENNPSGANGVLYFSYSSTTTPYLNMANGQTITGLSVGYSLLDNLSSYGGSVKLWSGLNGTGTLLYSLALSASTSPTACTSGSDEFCSWSTASTGAANFGAAESVSFGSNSTAIGTEFDSLQLTTVPLPGTSGLLAAGLVLLGLATRRRGMIGG